jgi:hypothetical protein
MVCRIEAAIPPIIHQDGHLLEIISIFAVISFPGKLDPVTIEPDFAGRKGDIESHLNKLTRVQPVNPCFRNAKLEPFAGSKDGMGRIAPLGLNRAGSQQEQE